MKLSIVIPTYNRADSLRKTLQSLAQAESPLDLEVEILVADNNSNDHTPKVVEEMRSAFAKIKLGYMFEKEQGRSFALNSALRMVDGDLISTIDHDEEVDPTWLDEVEKLFGDRWDEIDFAGGITATKNEFTVKIRRSLPGRTVSSRHRSLRTLAGITKPSACGAGLYQRRRRGFLRASDQALDYRGIYNPKMVIYHQLPAYRLQKN